MIEVLPKEILGLLTAEEKTSYGIFKNAVTTNMLAYNDDPTAARKNNLDVAESALREIIAVLTAKYAPPHEEPPVRRATMKEWSEFIETTNKAEVLRQLLELGYGDLTQRTFYRDCKDGKCRKNGDGLYSRRLVKQYVETKGLLRTGEAADDNGPDVALSIAKQQLENEKLDWHNKNARLDYEKKAGALIDRDGVYLEIAARYVALDNAFRQKLDTTAAEMIATVGGDQARILEFTEMVAGMWDELLNSFVTMDEFEVIFQEEGQA